MYQPPIKINKGKFLKKNKPDPTSRELAESVGGVAGLVFELKQLQSDVVETVDTKLTEIEKTTTASVKKIDDKVSEFEKTAIGLIKDVQALPHLKGDPGKDADEQKIADYVMSKFPKPLDTSKLTKDILAQVPKLDTKALTKTILEAIPENKASLKIIQEKFEVDPMSVIEKIMALPEGKFKLKTSQVDGLQQTMEAFRSQLGRGYLHGGGDTVAAGTNITITTNSAGQKVISTSGGATGVTSFNTRTGAVTLTSGDVTTALGFTPGTVSSVASADSSITVTNPTSTVDLAVVKSPKLTTARNIAITGDLAWNVNFDGSANVTAAGTLTTVNGNVGTFGSATQVVQVTVNAKGLVTAASNITVTPTVGSITGLGAGVATFLATPSSANLAAAVSDETGSGALVFATSPTFTTNFLVAGSSSGTTTIQATAAASGTLTLPAATDTLVGKATTDTLTNKTLDNSIVTGDLSIYFGSNIRTQDNTSGKSFSLSAYDLTDTALNPLITLTNGTVASLTIAPTGSSLVNITASNLSISGDSEGLDFSGTGDHLIQSSAGNLLFGTCSILGVTDASNASSGYIGEIISSSVASGSAVSLTTTVVATVTSITLSAGDWEIYGSIAFSGGAVTATQSQGFFGTASGSSSTGRDLAKNTVSAGVGSSVSSDLTMAMPTYRVNITTPTTYYLKANSTFTIGSATTYGTIEARRMR